MNDFIIKQLNDILPDRWNSIPNLYFTQNDYKLLLFFLLIQSNIIKNKMQIIDLFKLLFEVDISTSKAMCNYYENTYINFNIDENWNTTVSLLRLGEYFCEQFKLYRSIEYNNIYNIIAKSLLMNYDYKKIIEIFLKEKTYHASI